MRVARIDGSSGGRLLDEEFAGRRIRARARELLRLGMMLLAADALSAPAGPATEGMAAPPIPGAHRVHAEPSPDEARRVQRLRDEADDLRRRLAEEQGRRATLLEQARALDQELALRRAEAEVARATADAEAARAERAARTSGALRGREQELRRQAAVIARALYAEGTDDPLARLVLGGEGGAQLASVTARRAAELATEVRRAREAAVAAAREASRRAAAAARAREDAERGERVAEQQAAARQRGLRELSARAAADVRLLDEMDAAQRELSASLAPRAPRRPVVAPSAPADLPGLQARRGFLRWPLDGRPRVLEAWGSVRDPRRGTRTFRHGITLEARRGDAMRAVADGRVLFVDWYKGFGRTLVLDHGEGFLSVYAHADDLAAAPGDIVREGDVVGSVGDTGSLDGPRLFFEIQRDGESVDPLDWLAR